MGVAKRNTSTNTVKGTRYSFCYHQVSYFGSVPEQGVWFLEMGSGGRTGVLWFAGNRVCLLLAVEVQAPSFCISLFNKRQRNWARVVNIIIPEDAHRGALQRVKLPYAGTLAVKSGGAYFRRGRISGTLRYIRIGTRGPRRKAWSSYTQRFFPHNLYFQFANHHHSKALWVI